MFHAAGGGRGRMFRRRGARRQAGPRGAFPGKGDKEEPGGAAKRGPPGLVFFPRHAGAAHRYFRLWATASSSQRLL